jgi:DNA-binding MarR family transcriptional regulator
MAEGKTEYQDFFNAQNEIHALFVRNLENILGPEGITVQQALTMKALQDQDQLCSMSELAAMRFLTPAAATGIVDRLIHQGLVERKFDESDRRLVLLALSPRGEALLSDLDGKIQAMMKGFFEHVSESDRAASLRMVKRLKEYLKEELNARQGK